MSFGNGASINVGTLSATFSLSASAAQSSINSIINQTNNLQQRFNQTNIVKVDTAQAVANVNKLSGALDTLKKGFEFGAGLAGFKGLESAIGSLGNSIIGMNAKLQTSQVAFTVLTGSAQTAATLVGQLETLASHSTFGLAQLQSGGQALLAYGVAAKNVPPLLQAIQNAAALAGGDTAEVFQRVSTVIGELASGLPVTERQIRQLAQAGVNIPQLAQQLGLTAEQLYNVGKTGVVTGGQVAAAFNQMYGEGGKFGNAMQAQANTFSGAMNIIKTNLSLAVAQGFQPLFQWISNVAVKIGQFVQTSTFQSWVAHVRTDIGAAIAILKTFMSVLEPIGAALAKVFGLKTGDLSKEMEAVKSATTDVGKYDASLQGAGASADDTKAKLAEYKQTVEDASAALLGLNDQLASNKVLLDANARSIAAVKNQYDPIIKSAEQSIKDINTPTADELSRKTQELQLDRDRANLELTKPDVSGFDSRILGDQTALTNMPALDTSSWDNRIATLNDQISNFDIASYTGGIQKQIDTLQESDPAATFKDQIQKIQDAMAALDPEAATRGITDTIQGIQDSIRGLNTDALDEKIAAIRDTLSQPAPDTTGIGNQLAVLSATLEGNPQDTSARAQYDALSQQKAGIVKGYDDQQTGLKGQLKLLEQQRADQALANAETKKADEARIVILQRQATAIKEGIADQREADQAEITRLNREASAAEKTKQDRLHQLGDDLKAAQARGEADRKELEKTRAQEEAGKKKAEAADAAARKQLTDDIKQAENERANALAPYTEALKKITDEQARNSALDAAAAAQRTLDLAPYKKALDDANQAKEDGLKPLDEEKQRLDDIRTKLQEQKTEQENAKQSAEANAKALKDGADNAGTLATNMGKVADAIPDDSRWGAFKDASAGEDSPFVSFLKLVNTNLTTLKGIIDNDVVPAVTRFGDWLKGDGLDGVKDLFHWLDANFTPALSSLWKLVKPDLLNVLGDLSRIVGFGLLNDFKSWKTAIDDLIAPTLRLLIEVLSGQLHTELSALHYVLSGQIFEDIGKVTGKFNDFVLSMKGEGGVLGTLGSLLSWVEGNWGSIGTALSTPFVTAWDGIKTFFSDLHAGLAWLADHFKLPEAGNLPWEGGGGAPAANGGDNAVRGYAAGVVNSPRPGHWAVVGEKGPEPMFVPQGATIVPNGLAGAMGMLPGHADGFNVENVFGALGGIVAGSAGRFAAALMDKLPAFDIPGAPAAAGILTKQIGEGVATWLATSPLNAIRRALTGGMNLPGMWHHFSDLSFDDFMRVLGSYPDSPIADQGDFGTLLDVAKENSIDPRFLMAVMQTESGYGANAGRIGDFWNFIGMGMNDRGWAFDSGVHATDGGPEYAGYHSFHDMLEDLSAWLIANNGDISGYQQADQGQGKSGAYAQILAMTGGGGNYGGSAFGGGGYQDVLQAAAARLGETFHDGHLWDYWCEQFVETVDRDAGYSLPNYDDAWTHGSSLALSGGTPPAGASAFWSPGGGWSAYGHTAVSVGDGTFITTSPSGIVQAGNGWLDSDHYAGWSPPGLADGGYFPGGAGHLAVIGEGPEEIAAPVPMLREIVRSEAGGMTINFHPGAIVAAPGMDTRDLANAVVSELDRRVSSQRRGRGLAG